ncbi:hypothetical protein DFH09DRAFT_1088400 [Mycena vulgaris]|nr:hypothetical protein DFH09DRAFT_1088400 [Mycena vulgaris]
MTYPDRNQTNNPPSPPARHTPAPTPITIMQDADSVIFLDLDVATALPPTHTLLNPHHLRPAESRDPKGPKDTWRVNATQPNMGNGFHLISPAAIACPREAAGSDLTEPPAPPPHICICVQWRKEAQQACPQPPHVTPQQSMPRTRLRHSASSAWRTWRNYGLLLSSPSPLGAANLRPGEGRYRVHQAQHLARHPHLARPGTQCIPEHTLSSPSLLTPTGLNTQRPTLAFKLNTTNHGNWKAITNCIVTQTFISSYYSFNKNPLVGPA